MKGILFDEILHQKVIDGSKTVTRRMLNPQHVIIDNFGRPISNKGDIIKPRYKVGDTVFLKEPYCEFVWGIEYKFDKKTYPEVVKWENRLFMPEKYARTFIKITDVRCEKLQEITYKDCILDGIRCRNTAVAPYELIYQISNSPNFYYTEKQAYAALIDKINGKGTWDSNPYVWRYEFELQK